MKKILAMLMVLTLVFSVSVMAKAKIKVSGRTLSSSGTYLGAKGLGIGLVFGLSNGISVKTWLDRDGALQFDFNWNAYSGSLGVGAAYLYHNIILIEAEDNKFPVYFGIKGWVSFSATVGAGIQIPVGIAWIPRNAPIDVFLQVEPGLNIINMGFAPGGGIGIRYWLD